MSQGNGASSIDRVLVVGAGTMGQGIAQVCAIAGYAVDLFDVDAAVIERALTKLADGVSLEVERGRLSRAEAAAALARLAAGESETSIGRSTLVIEAVREDLQVKQSLFAALERRAHAETVFATNTSSLSVTAVGAACSRPGRVAGLHFFNPVPRMRIVEVVRGLKTEDATISRLLEVARRIGCQPVLTSDSPGFVVNHAGRAFVTEALQIAAEGVADFATIDAILRETAGFRMGPFELLDLTGLDVSHPVMESIYRQYYEDGRYRPSTISRLRLSGGLLGRKSGAGFYTYPRDKAPAASEPDSATRPSGLSVFLAAGADGIPAALRQRFTGVPEVKIVNSAAAADVCLVAPLGADAATAVERGGLPAERTVAVDGLFFTDAAVTLMTSAATTERARSLAGALVAAASLNAHWIGDSSGFVAQRVVGMMIHLACEIAQQRIAAPADIDRAVKLALGYPKGPFEWGRALGPARVLALMQQIFAATGDSRYRPSQWLRRRVQLGIELDVVE